MRPISHRAPSSEPPIDGHAFSTMEKLRVNVGEELLHQTSVMLSRYDDEKTDSSSDEDDTTLDTVRFDTIQYLLDLIFSNITGIYIIIQFLNQILRWATLYS